MAGVDDAIHSCGKFVQKVECIDRECRSDWIGIEFENSSKLNRSFPQRIIYTNHFE